MVDFFLYLQLFHVVLYILSVVFGKKTTFAEVNMTIRNGIGFIFIVGNFCSDCRKETK
jgi:hypothetical protein